MGLEIDDTSAEDGGAGWGNLSRTFMKDTSINKQVLKRQEEQYISDAAAAGYVVEEADAYAAVGYNASEPDFVTPTYNASEPVFIDAAPNATLAAEIDAEKAQDAEDAAADAAEPDEPQAD